MKSLGLAYKRPESYQRIHMPKNTWAGIVISGFAMVMGIAMIWHIWWLAIAGLVGVIGSWIIYAFEPSKDYYVEVDEIKAIENERYKDLARSKNVPDTGEEHESLVISI
jgi:cytochrome o ubiquinol oxidase subunit 1